MVEVPASVLSRYRYWSLYNSPYAAHARGCAIDLYPPPGTAPSPVAGKVLDTRTVRAPPKPYAPEHDHLIVIDTEEAPSGSPYYRTPDGVSAVARVLHVEPTVEPGEVVDVGDDLGEPVRAGFFAPWVENHLHLGFRDRNADPYRAGGSLRIDPDVEVTGLRWDGTGTVVETGDTYALLDVPEHPDPGASFVGIEADGGGVLDGGLPHYDGGGVLTASGASDDRTVGLLGKSVGKRRGRTIEWSNPTVVVNGDPITGLSLFVSRTGSFGAKLICPERPFQDGDRVTVRIE